MSIRDIMSENVEVVSPDTSLREAAKKMRSGDFGVLPVCEDNKIVGMITDRDICIRAVADGDDPDQVMVREAMSEEVMTCREDQEIEDVAEMMADRKVRRIPVLGEDDKLVGIVSLGDLAVNASDRREVSETFEEVSQPTQH